jgi:hypothetical protein
MREGTNRRRGRRGRGGKNGAPRAKKFYDNLSEEQEDETEGRKEPVHEEFLYITPIQVVKESQVNSKDRPYSPEKSLEDELGASDEEIIDRGRKNKFIERKKRLKRAALSVLQKEKPFEEIIQKESLEVEEKKEEAESEEKKEEAESEEKKEEAESEEKSVDVLHDSILGGATEPLSESKHEDDENADNEDILQEEGK